MPLQVTAYRQLVALDDCERDPDGHPSDTTAWYAHPETVAFTERGWPGYAAGIVSGGAYGFAESYSVRMGTYSHFNQWRRVLTTMLTGCTDAWEDRPTQPFAELTSFADSDGIISGPVAAKLAKDFADFQPYAEAFAKDFVDGRYWISRYKSWRKVFEVAADNGAVEFH